VPAKIALISVRAPSRHVLLDGPAPGPQGSGQPGGRTLPFVAASELLSGCGSVRTGVTDEATRGLNDRVPRLAASLKALGYRGLGLPGDPLLHAGSGLARGFERYSTASPAIADSARADSARVWLALPGKRFAWLDLETGLPAEVWRRGDGDAPSPEGSREWFRALQRFRGALPKGTLLALAWIGDGGEILLSVGARDSSGTAAGTLADIAPTLVAAAGGKTSEFEGRVLGANAKAPRPPSAPPDADLSRAFGGSDACRGALMSWISAGNSDSLALRSLDSLGAACPSSPRIALERAVATSRTGRETEAARQFKSLIAAHPDYPEATIAYADHLLRYERYDVVGPALDVIAPDSPLAALAAWRKALALAGRREFPAAVGEVRRASTLAVLNPSGFELEGKLIALESLNDAVKRDDRDTAARLAYGKALGDLGLYDAAYEQLHAARALLPHSAEPDYQLALLLLAQGRPQHAAPTLRRALEHDSTHVPSRLALADALLQLGQRKEARTQLERALRDGPGDARAEFNLACLRAGDGEKDGAFAALERAVDLGYDDLERLEGDPDLDPLRGDPRYSAAVRRAKDHPPR
jgi:tetratricopeptide (TPR) repeat protein